MGMTHLKTVLKTKVRKPSCKTVCWFCPALNKIDLSRRMLVEIQNLKFHWESFWSLLIAAFRSCFEKAPRSGEDGESLCEQVTYALSFEAQMTWTDWRYDRCTVTRAAIVRRARMSCCCIPQQLGSPQAGSSRTAHVSWSQSLGLCCGLRLKQLGAPFLAALVFLICVPNRYDRWQLSGPDSRDIILGSK